MKQAGSACLALGMLLMLAAGGCSGGIGANSSNPGGQGGLSGGAGGPATMGGGGSYDAGATGTGGFAAGSGGSSSSSDAAGSPDAGSDGRDAGAGASCMLILTPLSAAWFLDPVERGPTPFRVHAQATSPGDYQWNWTISSPGGALQPMKVAGDPATVEFPLPVSGTYTIVVSTPNRQDCGSTTAVLTVIEPRPTAFLFRVFPPPAMALPAQEFRLTSEQLKSAGITLNTQVRSIRIFPSDSPSHPLPSYVQLSSQGSLTIEGNTQGGPVDVALLSERQYDLLVIPIPGIANGQVAPQPGGGAVAPKLFSGLPAQLSGPQMLDPGISVTGAALRSDGTPVADARVVLRAGARPSTVGVSDADGTFSLFTRDGAMAVDVSAPPGSGLPDAHVDATAGVLVAPAAAGLTMTMRWAQQPAGSLALTVHAPDGTTALANAAVVVELDGPIASAGTLTVRAADGGGGPPLDASARVRAAVTSDATGTVAFPALPVGQYRVTVAPPAGATAAAGAAITTTTVDVTAAGVTTSVQLGRKVTVTGALQDGSAGTRIVAIDTGLDVVAPSAAADVDSHGNFTLALDPGRTYKLWATPPAAGQRFARGMLATLTAPQANQTLSAYRLPPGVAITSNVFAGQAVGDALVQVFCPDGSLACPDTSLPIAETVTSSDGKFSVVLPDSN